MKTAFLYTIGTLVLAALAGCVILLANIVFAFEKDFEE